MISCAPRGNRAPTMRIQRLCTLVLVTFFIGQHAVAQQPPYRDPKLPVEQRVADLLSRMTLEEKAAQLGSTWQNLGILSDPAMRKQLAFIDEHGKLLPERAK